jgi:hypothetical protein
LIESRTGLGILAVWAKGKVQYRSALAIGDGVNGAMQTANLMDPNNYFL